MKQVMTEAGDEPLLRLEGIDVPGLAPVALGLTRGECLTLSGPSGSGKSRLLRAIADLDPHGGEAWLAGKACSAIPPQVWRRQVSLLPASSAWWAHKVAGHFLDTARLPLAEVGLEAALLEQEPEHCSSGERQRLALLRLLENEPRVLLLDEPTASLDEENTLRVEALLRRWLDERGAAAIWVSHDRQQRRRVGDRHYNLNAGRLVEASP